MEYYKLKLNDRVEKYFHFTKESNLNNIEKKGLVPKIGKHAKYLEKTRKIFFVEGLDNLLILFDCWINAWYYMPSIPLIYTLGAHLIRQKWFPDIVADTYFNLLKKNKIHEKKAFKIFDELLDTGVLLNLDLKENIDFKYDDNDEIKLRGYKKRHLELMGYSSKYSDLDNNIVDRWNMHTFTNHKIESNKIRLCTLENCSYKLRDIFNYCVKNTKINIENTCPILYKYLNKTMK